MRRIELHADAKADIIQIAEYGASQFGIAQANLYQDELGKQFELIADHPRIGRALTPRRPHLFRFGFGRHVIIYAFTDEEIVIRRILHDRMDLLRHLNTRQESDSQQ